MCAELSFSAELRQKRAANELLTFRFPVPHNQSEILWEALQKAGVKLKLHIVEGGGHGGFKDPAIEKMVEDFFDKHLKPAEAEQ